MTITQAAELELTELADVTSAEAVLIATTAANIFLITSNSTVIFSITSSIQEFELNVKFSIQSIHVMYEDQLAQFSIGQGITVIRILL